VQVDHVNAPLAAFALADKCLRFSDLVGELRLSQSRARPRLAAPLRRRHIGLSGWISLLRLERKQATARQTMAAPARG